MKLKIIETEDYVLAVSDKVRVNSTNDWYYEHDNCISLYQFTKETLPREYYLPKVIAYQPKNNVPELDLPLLPEIGVEDEVEKLAEEFVRANLKRSSQAAGVMIGFIEGHKSATKIYTEEDLRKAIEMARGIKEGKETFTAEDISGCTEVCTYGWEFEFENDEIIKSLKQPKTPKYFVAEMDNSLTIKGEADYFNYNDGIKLNPNIGKLKTTTKNNKTYLIGNYE
jgi:hypothetical protein